MKVRLGDDYVLIRYPRDYVELVSDILCLALEYGRVYTVTSTGRKYLLYPKVITVETGSIVRYKVNLYSVSRDIDPKSVVTLVLGGALLSERQLERQLWVELVIEKNNEWWGSIEGVPRSLFSSEELAELVKALHVDGMRCRMGVVADNH